MRKTRWRTFRIPRARDADRKAIDYFSIATIVPRFAAARESDWYRSVVHSWSRPANNRPIPRDLMVIALFNNRSTDDPSRWRVGGNFRETRLPNEPWILQDMEEEREGVIRRDSIDPEGRKKSLSARTGDNSIRSPEARFSRRWAKWETPSFPLSLPPCPKFERFDGGCFSLVAKTRRGRGGSRAVRYGAARLSFILAI